MDGIFPFKKIFTKQFTYHKDRGTIQLSATEE
ncbi:hypothetical protein a15_110 [Escherichia phage a15]|nr:hypothetical protein 101112UKE3-1_106 [Escherichia phage vB_EcoM-101112UKE3-1]WBF82383.1 hypothetical protein a15_110 [Escherichia phage a15]